MNNMDKKQLFEKINSTFSKIYPITKLESVVDSEDNKLKDIILNYNHLYINYAGTVASTRLLVPVYMRRTCIWITYKNGTSIITEMFKGTNADAVKDNYWIDDNNWEEIPNIKMIEDTSLAIPSKAILPEHLSDSVLQLLTANTVINNYVDEEDLTTKDCGIIKFKDKQYNPMVYSGKGTIILRKNWVGNKNILLQTDINKIYTIYEVRYDFDLNGKTINLGRNSSLYFNGGSFKNGNIVFNGGTIYNAKTFDECGTASFTGNFAKGLIMYFDDGPKYYDGTNWKKFNTNEDTINYSAEIRSVGSSEIADAAVTLNNNRFIFDFRIPKGDKGDKGDKGEQGPAGSNGKDGVNGIDGNPGKDGNSYIAKYCKTDNKDTIPTFIANNINPGSIWGNSIPNISGDEVIWKIEATVDSKGNLTTNWDGPVLMSGIKGNDGTPPNYKIYVYKLSNDKIPNPPTGMNPSNPGDGWVDYPNTTGQWYQCIGTVNGSTNTIISWSTVLPVNGKDGIAQDGKKTEFRFNKNTSTDVYPTIDVTVREPDGWMTVPYTLGTDEFLWMTTATINPNNTLDGTWSIPVRISGEQGAPGVRGAQGPAGPSGPTGSQGVAGIPGIDIEIRYAIGNDKTYKVSNQTDDFHKLEPSGWSTDLNSVIDDLDEDYKYIWFIQARIGINRTYDDETDTYTDTKYLVDGTWSYPHLLSGINGLQGDPGTQGKKGQVVYPAGIYSTQTHYITDENKAPYVYDSSDGNFYVLNAIMDWIGSEQNNRTPSEDYALNNGNYWVKFEAFDAVYAKIGIIANGLIGSAVFNGDYMFSQQGIDNNGNISNHYEYFGMTEMHINNPSLNLNEPYAEDNLFKPNVCINFKTGETWLAAGNTHIKTDGSIEINNAEIKGALLKKEVTITPNDYYIQYYGGVKNDNTFYVNGVFNKIGSYIKWDGGTDKKDINIKLPFSINGAIAGFSNSELQPFMQLGSIRNYIGNMIILKAVSGNIYLSNLPNKTASESNENVDIVVLDTKIPEGYSAAIRCDYCTTGQLKELDGISYRKEFIVYRLIAISKCSD